MAPHQARRSRVGLAMLQITLLPLFATVYCATESCAQDPMHWRVWKNLGGLLGAGVRTISVSPNGRVWATRDSTPRFVWFDGYEVGSIPDATGALRAREGRGGQIWALNYDSSIERVVGILQYRYQQDLSDGKWIRHEIEDLKAAIALVPSATWEIPFLPGDRSGQESGLCSGIDLPQVGSIVPRETPDFHFGHVLPTGGRFKWGISV